MTQRENSMFVLDSHCDTPSQIYRGRDISKDNHLAHVDFPKLSRGGVDAAFFALYIPAELDVNTAYDYTIELYDYVIQTLDSNKNQAVLTTSREQAYKNKKNGLFSLFLGLENGSPLGCSLERIKEFYDLGVRYITLCHSQNNGICDSCASDIKRWHGLSPFGKEVVAEMNRVGMLIDVSHISDEAFYEVLDCSTRPVVATHSCCRALADHPRNMTDEMIRALAAKGGVIQINFYPVFLDDTFKEETMFESARPSYEKIVDHIDHVVSLVGIDHVGLGSDFDGIDVTPDGLDDISMMPKIFDEMRRRKYTEDDIQKVASGNFFRVFSFSDAEQS